MQDRNVVGHALVVGSPGDNLFAIDEDVRAIAEMLCSRGFAVDTRTGDRATRAGILDGYDALINNAQPEKPAVFYYTGHGFHAFPRTEPTKSWQGICPTDLGQSTDNDFRGITAWELSLKQTQLTARTRNVTTILDCCFASQMSRGAAAFRATPRVLPHPIRKGFTAHLDALRAMYPVAFAASGATGNPDAVRLVACGQNESAYEYQCDDGLYRGAFSDALLAVLREIGDVPVSWAALLPAIQTRVALRFAVQRPGIEGPARRCVFSLIEDDGSDAASIVATPEGFRIGMGHLRGVALNDVYGVMPSTSRTYGADAAIAEVEVSEVSGTYCYAVLRSWKNGASVLQDGAIAFPVEKHAVRHVVHISVPEAARAAVENEILATPTLRIAEPGEAATLPELQLVDTRLTIVDRIGALFPVGRFPEELPGMVKNLANLGAAKGLRDLEGEYGVSADEVAIDWGTVDRGQLCRMPEHGGALALRDQIYVRVLSKAQRPLYVHIFNIGLRGRISLVTQFAHTGVTLVSQQPELVLGQDFDGTNQGLNLCWPEFLPRDTPRTDEIVVIATASPTNLESLETVEQLGGVRGTGSKLRSLLAQLCVGGSRSADVPSSYDGFLVKRLSYLLHPLDAAIGSTSFQIDDRLLQQGAAESCDAWIIPASPSSEPSHRVVSVQIPELVVESLGALSCDVRVDALVCTRSRSAAGYHAWTRRYRGITAGARLELDGGVVFRGSVENFIDFYAWVSRDTRGQPDLSELLVRRATDPAFQVAARALSIGEGSATMPWIAAIGGSAVLARIARDLLCDLAGTSIGLCRTSCSVNERPGTIWQTELQRTADFSVAFLIQQLGNESDPGVGRSP